jgi:hypothetical protein
MDGGKGRGDLSYHGRGENFSRIKPIVDVLLTSVDFSDQGTDGLWARLRGKSKRVVLLLADSITGLLWPPLVARGEESAALGSVSSSERALLAWWELTSARSRPEALLLSLALSVSTRSARNSRTACSATLSHH